MAKKSLKDIIKLEFTKCAQDPVHFMKKYCYIQHPQKGKIKFNLQDIHYGQCYFKMIKIFW